MMDFIVVHRIKLFYISMSLVCLMTYYHEAYDALLYGDVCMVGVMVLRPYKHLFKTIEHWF